MYAKSKKETRKYGSLLSGLAVGGVKLSLPRFKNSAVAVGGVLPG
jgi:hypothetical protein